jgi:hypothetical protein
MDRRALLFIAPLLVTLLTSLTACAPAKPAPPRAASADLDAWISAEDAAPLRSSTTLSRASIPEAPPALPAADRWGSRTLAAVVAEPLRPRRGARIDVSFHKSDMANAFQLLADAGRFNLVMAENLNGQVSATLHRIDPYDALKSLAEANGVEVRYEGGVVLVKKR